MKIPKSEIGKNLGVVISENSPQILTGLGCAGLVSTAILSSKASPRAIAAIKEEEEYRSKKKLSPLGRIDKFKITWKYYIPTFVVGGTAIGCILGANTVHTKRNAALASLYTLSDSAFREYKSKVIQEIGLPKEIKIRDEVAKSEIARNPVTPGNVIVTGSGDVLCYDVLSGRYFNSSYETIRQKVNDLNYQLRNDGKVDLNEFYYAIGIDTIELGMMCGFDIEKGQIEPVYSTQLDASGKPCLVIGLEVYPNFLY